MASTAIVRRFQRHPDRAPGTWWAVREKTGTTPRLACPTCGELVFLNTSVHRIRDDGHVNAPVFCPKAGCWHGRVQLEGWEA